MIINHGTQLIHTFVLMINTKLFIGYMIQTMCFFFRAPSCVCFLFAASPEILYYSPEGAKQYMYRGDVYAKWKC